MALQFLKFKKSAIGTKTTLTKKESLQLLKPQKKTNSKTTKETSAMDNISRITVFPVQHKLTVFVDL